MKYVSIILDDNLEKTLDYKVPDNLQGIIKPGMRVEIPIKNTSRKGIVYEVKKTTEIKNIKFINKVISKEVISKEIFSLALWMSRYYCSSLSKILKNILPTSIRKEIKPKEQIFLSLNQSKQKTVSICSELARKNSLQNQVLELFLKVKKGLFLSEILMLTNSSRSPIDTLIKKKYLKSKKVCLDNESLLLEHEYFKTHPKKLNTHQEKALRNITNTMVNSAFETHLLFGVTGSGKTEVYLQAIKKALDLGKTAIMLVPEIALTSQTIERFKARFDEKIAIIHHKRSQGERYEAWQQIVEGEAKIVIGARSAVFSPLKNLGLIIVDEEHDSSYKQSEESPSYHARNIAVMRGKIENLCVVLASATPAIESYTNALNKKYKLSILPNRAQKTGLPDVHIVDMKRELNKNKGFTHFSQKLLDGIKKRYKNGEQTLLFLNRRGYHNFLMCKKCSHVLKCPHCDISLTFHKKQNILSCHSCEYKILPVRKCPVCQNSEHLQYKGFGTEHVEASLKAIMPEVRTLRVDRDTTTQKNSHEKIFKEFKSGKADVLIGTQMIVKGLHFPSVTLVGVLNTDGALNIPDFRSSENVFQLITQVSGRAGRQELIGEVIVQTFMPDNSTIKLAAKQDYLNFYKDEIENRKMFCYPPFQNIIKINISSNSEDKAKEFAEHFRKKLIDIMPGNINIHPVIPAGRFKEKDKYKFHFLLRGKNSLLMTEKITAIKNRIKKPSNISMFIDVDPINIFF